MNTTSVTLLDRVKERTDVAAWDQFVRLYTPLLFTWAGRFGWPAEEADDFVQELLLLLLDKLPGFEHRGTGSFRAWLRTVAVNKCRERARRCQQPAGIGGDDDPFASVVAAAESDHFWESEYRQHLMSLALEVMQTEFESSTWQVCWQRVVEGRPVAEVASQFGLTEAAVYVYTGRVLRRLREQLQGLIE